MGSGALSHVNPPLLVNDLMAKFPLALGTQSNKGKSPLEGVARLINCRIEIGGDEQRVKYAAQSVAGLDPLCTLTGTGGVRALIEVDGTGYAVAGRVVHQFESGGTSFSLGGMPSDGLVTMTRNYRASGAQTMIVCDGLAKYIEAGSLIEVIDPDVGQPNSVTYVQNHFVTSGTDGYLRASEINDASQWDAFDATRGPDGLIRVEARGSSVVAFGESAFQVWDYSGSTTEFPFNLVHTSRVGCYSAGSVVTATVIRPDIVSDVIVWCSTDHTGAYAGVVMLDGYTARKISTHSVDRDIRRASTPSAITACSYVENGHAYIAITIPDVTTWVYDTATQLWHERQSKNLDHWLIATTCTLGGRIVGGHRTLPKLYWVDPDTYDEDGNELTVTLQTPPLHGFPDQVEINALYLDCVTGVGLNTTVPANLDPVVMMQTSYDNETWGTELSRALGRQGHSQTRLAWHGLGTTDHRGVSFRFRASAACVRTIMMAQIDGAKIAA